MFEDSLMESTRHFSKRRGWIILLSSGLQMFVLSILVMLPLLRTSAISPQHITVHPVLPYVSQPISSGSHPLSGTTDSGGITPVIVPMTQPGSIPRVIARGPEPEGHPIAVSICVVAGCGTGPGLSVPDSITIAPPPVVHKPPEKLVISRFDPGQVIRRIEPIYPPLARAARVQGTVVLHAIISRQGTVERLGVASGHPMLDRAAIEAVSQWLFRPYILNGQPIEVETQITVNFILGGS